MNKSNKKNLVVRRAVMLCDVFNRTDEAKNCFELTVEGEEHWIQHQTTLTFTLELGHEWITAHYSTTDKFKDFMFGFIRSEFPQVEKINYNNTGTTFWIYV